MGLNKKPLMSDKGIAFNRTIYQINIKTPADSKGQRHSVVGNMKNNFTYSLNAEWANLFTNLVPGAELLQKLGDASLMSGVFSRKYFKGGNHLTFNAEFRIFDDGSGDTSNVIDAAKELANLVVADPFNAERTAAIAKRKGKAIQKHVPKIVNGAFNADLGAVATGAENLFNQLTDSNRIVDVTIGSFFRCRAMIITAINVTYSREINDKGPLFADFSVSLETMQALVRGSGVVGVDNILNGRNFRITINGQNTQQLASEEESNRFGRL